MFYKYLPTERVTYFDDELLRFTQPAALNDPWEGIPSLPDEDIKIVFLKIFDEQIIKEKLYDNYKSLNRKDRRRYDSVVEKRRKERISIFNSKKEELREFLGRHAHDKMNYQIGLLSLSKRWNNSLMWSHYTTSHQGFCVGFNEEHHFFLNAFQDKYQMRSIFDVIYSNERVRVPTERGKSIDFKVMCIKSKDWEYEQEVRMFAMLADSDYKKDIEPYPVHLFKVPKNSVTEIIVGCRANEQFIEKLKLHSKRLKVPLYMSVPSRTTFDVERIKI